MKFDFIVRTNKFPFLHLIEPCIKIQDHISKLIHLILHCHQHILQWKEGRLRMSFVLRLRKVNFILMRGTRNWAKGITRACTMRESRNGITLKPILEALSLPSFQVARLSIDSFVIRRPSSFFVKFFGNLPLTYRHNLMIRQGWWSPTALSPSIAWIIDLLIRYPKATFMHECIPYKSSPWFFQTSWGCEVGMIL